MEEAVLQTEKVAKDKEIQKVQSQKIMEMSTMEINGANSISTKSFNIVSKNKFDILDGLVEEGEIVFFEVIGSNIIEGMKGLNKDTKVNFKSNMEGMKEVIEMKEGGSSNIKRK
ncbi:hypothetical protein MA16_Dca027454 [Dendrobium catenatum]|uniref:Uncharacterized protein n=1 Tax=Dendrobium catenatum TaxID=906689 RepID=A0A2I0W1G8_9ASPA|nr:hypothetical protein MA16_Dca027454 [Dendrobium catenatum]